MRSSIARRAATTVLDAFLGSGATLIGRRANRPVRLRAGARQLLCRYDHPVLAEADRRQRLLEAAAEVVDAA